MKKILFFFTLLIGMDATETKAHEVSTIYRPEVSKGVLGGEFKAAYAVNEDGSDDGAGAEATASYGFTDFWQGEAGVELAYEQGEGSDVSGVVFENTFRFAPPGAWPVDAGLKLDYAHSLTGGADDLVARLLLAKSFGRFNHIANLNVGREIGEESDDDTAYGVAYGLNYALSDDVAAGLEWHSDFGNFKNGFSEQGHRAGPVLYGEFAGMEYEVGALIGVSRSAPDAEIKFAVERAF